MELSNIFYDAVSSGAIRKVRIMMKDSLLVDPTFTEFYEMEKASRNLEGLYDEHDGRALNSDKNTWDDNYMNKLMVQVVGNFSHERINHLKEVVHYLRPVEKQPLKEATKNSTNGPTNNRSGAQDNNRVQHNPTSYQEQKHKDQLEGNYRGAKIASGAVVGAVIGGAVVASVTSITVIGGMAAGAVVGGVVTAVATAERR